MNLVNFTELVVKNLVTEKDMVKVQEFTKDDDSIILEVIVHEDDMGSVIGRGGKVASAIRTIVQAYAYINKLGHVNINIDSFK